MNPLVSIIIPVYNVKPYLREALDSVIDQTYKNTEILIVDDGSTDGSESICDEYNSDTRVTVIHQENRGLSGARNTGLDIVEGDYLCFLDPDDAYNPHFIEKLLDRVISNQADMAVCKFTMQKTTEKLGTKALKYMPQWPHLAQGIYTKEDALRNLVEGELDVSVWNKLYRSNLWSNIRFPNGRNFEDIDTMFRVLDLCRTISVIDNVLLYKRERIGSITHNYSLKNIHDLILACSNLESLIQSQYPRIFSDALIERYKQGNLNAYMDIFANCYQDKELRNEIREIIVEKGREIKHWNIRTRVAYSLICHIPSLFIYAYKIYRAFIMLTWKVTGK